MGRDHQLRLLHSQREAPFIRWVTTTAAEDLRGLAVTELVFASGMTLRFDQLAHAQAAAAAISARLRLGPGAIISRNARGLLVTLGRLRPPLTVGRLRHFRQPMCRD